MLLRRYKRNEEIDQSEEVKQLEEQELEMEQPGEVRDETDITVTDEEDQYKGLTVDELKEAAKEKGLSGYSNKKRDELIKLLKGE